MCTWKRSFWLLVAAVVLFGLTAPDAHAKWVLPLKPNDTHHQIGGDEEDGPSETDGGDDPEEPSYARAFGSTAPLSSSADAVSEDSERMRFLMLIIRLSMFRGF